MDIQSSLRHKIVEKDYRGLWRALCRGYGNQLAERMLHDKFAMASEHLVTGHRLFRSRRMLRIRSFVYS
ncbi:hypothetical protein MA16_Dca020719 [Dendrobium catenatum]|uniref:Uncharacterized protein n=1 Tax=Dendrobium catenatum TaxID=906689 RepID=A0A2I0WIU2_9ASPA|nr:hypothetical protein MA16_Dca020719 [Dendrobium catenatum]